ncbi:MAG: alpha/beta fold hydrolase [Gammaproteobacteria bacterium]|nr:alpha/beta fold hydrolase [Gammaproteobacteria bacterium]
MKDANLTEKFITIDGSKVHYLEMGQGDPILFLHGVPTSSHVWRNVIPLMAEYAHCVAPDLTGCGQTSGSNSDLSPEGHLALIEKFVEKLHLKNCTLVLHGLGSSIGFEYTAAHPENVKAVAFYEAQLQPVSSWEMLSLPMQHLLYIAKFKTVDFMRKLLRSMSLKLLTDKEVNGYFSNGNIAESSASCLWGYVQKFSSSSNNYAEKLKNSAVPKLLMYNTPGFLTTMDSVVWCQDNLSNIKLADLDEGLHLAQEDNPKLFATVLTDWYLSL